MNAFSVLLPVYRGDNPAHFERALQSVGADQTLQADEILIVCDGPVHPDVEALLQECENGQRPDIHGSSRVKVVRMPRNQGLSAALNIGLEAAEHDVIARADADDISIPTRFATQIPLMDTYDLVGAAIAEFEADENTTGIVRYMPATQAEIRRIVTYRDPFNHPTVVYTRQSVQRVGGYEHVNFMEDYWLFARMVAAGTPCMNVHEALVKYRIGEGAYKRRGGMTLMHSEMELQRRLLKASITNPLLFARNVAIRGGYRLIPPSVRKFLYQNIGKRFWFNDSGAGDPS